MQDTGCKMQDTGCKIQNDRNPKSQALNTKQIQMTIKQNPKQYLLV